MLVPMKHEKLETNILVIGAFIIEQLLSGVELTENILENYIKNNKVNDIDAFYDAMIFLYCIDAIELTNYTVRVVQR